MTIERVGWEQPAANKEIVQKHIKRLEVLREYKDEAPAEMVHSTSVDNKFKVRKGWWAGIVLSFRLLVEDNLLPKEMCREIDCLCKKYCDDSFRERMTTEEDIDEANVLLEKIVNELNKNN